jgi:uncharacterized membrane protein YgcG
MRSKAVSRTIRAIALTLIMLLAGAPATLAVSPVAVVVEDRAGVLDRNALVSAVGRIEFYEPTTVAVYTYNGKTDDNLNEEVLRFARAAHPEWISPDGQKWANGLFIFALDPVGRHVGTYMGEDRKVSLDQRADIQDAAKELLRDAQWTDGTIAGIRRGAELINQPWYRSPAASITAWGLGGVLAAGAATWLILRATTRGASRREIERGDHNYSSVSTDLDVTELNASTIPSSSSYGSLVLEKHVTFLDHYNRVTELSQRVHAMKPADLSRRRNLKVVREYAAAARELDALDDVIADTNALLNRGSTWRTAWEHQLAPFRSDLEGLDQLLSKRHGQGDSDTAAALRSFKERSLQDLERWTADLAEGKLEPERALDRLRDARTQLSALLENHANTVIAGFSKDEREAQVMRTKMENAREGVAKNHRRPNQQPNILGTVYPSYYFISVPTFNSGLDSGISSVNASRGGGSTTGYGSSGGSFSGSGSSSGF